MKSFLLLSLIVVICISTCGCSQPVAEQSVGGTPVPTLVADEPAPAAGSPLATLSNYQPNTVLTLNPGIILVSFQVKDPQILKINQQCKQGWVESSEIRITGPYDGSIAIGIPTQDECTINISASGTWTAQVTEFSMDNPLQIPVNLSGSGTAVSSPFSLERGQYIFQREETGEASPRYYLTDAKGNYLMDANNSFVQPGFGTFSPDTFRIIDVPLSGTYFVSVISNDKNPLPWHISILSIPPDPQMGPGPAIRETT